MAPFLVPRGQRYYCPSVLSCVLWSVLVTQSAEIAAGLVSLPHQSCVQDLLRRMGVVCRFASCGGRRNRSFIFQAGTVTEAETEDYQSACGPALASGKGQDGVVILLMSVRGTAVVLII